MERRQSDAAVLNVIDKCSGGEGVVHMCHNRVVNRIVHTLEHTGKKELSPRYCATFEDRIVGVHIHSDGKLTLKPGPLDGTISGYSTNPQDDVRAAVNLGLGHVSAKRFVAKTVGILKHGINRMICPLCPIDIRQGEVIHRRDGHAGDDANFIGFCHETCQRACQVRGFINREMHSTQVCRVAWIIPGHIHDREMDAGIIYCGVHGGIAHHKANCDAKGVSRSNTLCNGCNIVGFCIPRRWKDSSIYQVLSCCPLKPFVSHLVKPIVINGSIRDQTHHREGHYCGHL